MIGKNNNIIHQPGRVEAARVEVARAEVAVAEAAKAREAVAAVAVIESIRMHRNMHGGKLMR